MLYTSIRNIAQSSVLFILFLGEKSFKMNSKSKIAKNKSLRILIIDEQNPTRQIDDEGSDSVFSNTV
jgi:hypothetical protein